MANSEWELLRAIVEAGNKQDFEKMYAILTDESVDFSDKPNCIHAALTVISLIKEHVSDNKESLKIFVRKVEPYCEGLRSSMRLGVLKQMLVELN